MSGQQYNIIFRGDIVFGFQLGDVKLRLQQLFKTDEAKINALFTGRPVALKRNLDMVSAGKYRAALLNAGAHVDIVAVEDSPAETTAPPLSKPVVSAAAAVAAAAVAAAAAAAPTVQPIAEGWSLSPVGANLLKAAEQTPFVARAIDTGGLELRPVGGNLLGADEQPPAVQAKVVAPDLEVAVAGADLLRADEKVIQPAVAIAENTWGLAEVGADLVQENEREIVLPALIAIPDVGLAPVGADLGQLKPEVKHLVPDISGLRLAD